ncbi:MAG: SpoIIE family protein phosphatase [Acidobacteriaceae bacterium]|nr:SpoIIE family protein phosphatase [Acidobacteriaceae bacterium]
MSHPLQRVGLALLCVVFVVLQARWTYETIYMAFHWDSTPPGAIEVDPGSLAITWIDLPELTRAGAKIGDVVVGEDGRTVKSYADVMHGYYQHRAGDRFTIRLRRGTAAPFDVGFTIPSPGPMAPADIWTPIPINVLIPWSCTLLGFLVAFKRPSDPVAYALLALLLCIGHFLTANGGIAFRWGPLFTWTLMFLSQVTNRGLTLSWLWFALLFPDPRSRYKLLPWVGTVIGIPYALYALVVALLSACLLHSAAFAPWYPSGLALRGWLEGTLNITFIALGFANLAYKLRRETDLTVRRRLRWMMFGLALGIAPVTIMLGIATALHANINHIPPYILVPVVVSPFLVPLTLAYAVLVNRLFDVGVFLRQGLLASKTITAIRLLLVGLLILLVLDFERRKDIGNVERWVVMIACLVAGLLIRRISDWTRRWVDRRFFQERVNTEQLLLELSHDVRRLSDPQTVLRTVTERVRDALHLVRAAALVPTGDLFVPAYESGAGAPAIPNGLIHHLKIACEPLTVPSGLLLPIATGSELHGVLSLGPKRSEEPYSGTDIQLLESVAHQTALALDNSRLAMAVAQEAAHRERITSELEIARQVQERLFPKAAPKIAGLDLSGRCRPAQTVGGDYFDFLPATGGCIGLAIGDVAGKGVPAALLMAALQASLRGLMLAGISEPAELITKLNQLIFDASPVNRFATFFYGLYDPASRRLRYCSAGHNPALLLAANRAEPQWLKTKGVALGLVRSSRYEQAEAILEPGDCLLLYTDGVTEARNLQEEDFGEDRLVVVMRENRSRCANDILNAVLGSVAEFSGQAPQFDDLTLIVANVTRDHI